jgi:hypothetical protein
LLELYLSLITYTLYGLLCKATNQQREPFLQTSAPAPAVMELAREDGLALKLDALA